MPRPVVACVDVRALPLQLAWRARPELRNQPLAIVAGEGPQASITELSAQARRHHLRPGMRLGAARNLVPTLRAYPLDAGAIEAAIAELLALLQTTSPRVEPDLARPGTFYLDPTGLDRLYGDRLQWAHAIAMALHGRGLAADVVVAHGRLPSLAIARSGVGVWVSPSPAETLARVHPLPIDVLGADPELLEALEQLGVRTLGQLLALPAASVRLRLGAQAAALHLGLSQSEEPPLQAHVRQEPIRTSFALDPPDMDLSRLVFGIRGALEELLRAVAQTLNALRGLEIVLTLERAATQAILIEPARPTRDARLLLELICLRLGGMTLAAPVECVVLEALLIAPEAEQLTVEHGRRRRDLDAAVRAMARVRAALGTPAVYAAELRSAHLPEACFAWVPWQTAHASPARGLLPRARMDTDAPREKEPPLMVRRVLSRPRVLPPSSTPSLHGPSRPRLEGDEVVRMFGPYRTSGGWWVRMIERDYYYAETAEGRLLWLFFDRPRGRWVLHGLVD